MRKGRERFGIGVGHGVVSVVQRCFKGVSIVLPAVVMVGGVKD